MNPRRLAILSPKAPCPERSRREGFALVTAIFLLVVLAALGAFIANISATSSITTAQDLRGSRAYHAAQSGLEWGLFQVLEASLVPIFPSVPDCPPPVNTTLTIEGYAVTVACLSPPPSYTQNNGAQLVIMYELTSTASAGGVAGGLDFVEREVRATVSKCWELVGGSYTECP